MNKRESFSSRWGFICACIGSAVGMGNIWMFPTRVSLYGGGSFLIPYFLFVILIGSTGVIGEMSFGRAAKSGPIDAFGIACEKRGRRKSGEALGMIPVIGSLAMAIGFGRQGLLADYNAWNIIVAIVTMTTGSALLMWIGEQITEKGVGNGISIVLLFNILSSVPDDMKTLYYRFIFGQTVTKMIFSVVVIALIILAMVVFVIVLNDAERRIPVQYSKKMVGRKMVGGQASNIPLKINTAGVMPVIFASSIMSFPVVISQFFTIDPNSIGSKILMVLNSGSWCRPEYPIYSIGLVIYIALLIMFAYFYTSITFNPLEVANNMKKQGGFIPGIRPGKPTSDYLNKILNYIVFIGACGLIVIAVVPILASGLLNVSRISFSGTSLIIIVGVVLETIKAVESQMLVRYYKGFLND